jgi:hypothetical protein
LRASRRMGHTRLLDLAAPDARGLQNRPPKENQRAQRDPQERAQGMPGVRCTRGWCKKCTGSRHRFTGFNRHSLHNGFTVSFVLSPVIGLCCHRRSWEALASQELDAGLEASGPHDFAVRFSATRQLRRPRPPHPVPRFVTIASRPSGGRDGCVKATDLPSSGRQIFFA